MSIVSDDSMGWADADYDIDSDLRIVESDSYEKRKSELLKRITSLHPDLKIGKVDRQKIIPKKNSKKNAVHKSQTKLVSKIIVEKLHLPAETATVTATVTKCNSPKSDDDRQEELFQRFLTPRVPRIIHCDTVTMFPTAFANCLNSGNNVGLSDLIRIHLDNQCDIRLTCGSGSLSCYSFLKFFELMNEIHPDRIMHVSNTDMVDNRLSAAVFMKYTDCKTLYNAVARTVTDPSLQSVVPATRAQYLHSRMKLELRPEGEREELTRLVDSDFDLVVYGCIHVHLILDANNRATGLQMSGAMTSAHMAEVHSSAMVV